MKRILKRFIRPLVRTRIREALCQYSKYFAHWRRYKKLDGAEIIKLKSCYPCLFDNISNFSPTNHYYYQDIWGLKNVYESKVDVHIDVGSKAEYVGFLTAITNVEFVDIRPLDAPYLKNFKNIKGSILEMPYEDCSIKSLSCLHVAEHVGLGRYGDPLDPYGTQKAARELTRCLAKGGNLYFSLPVGKPRLCFNAHRVHSPQQILDYFKGLRMVEFSVYDDQKRFIENTNPQLYAVAKFACGMFKFTKD